MNSEALRILFATPECAPWVKTGGLGDVSAGLPAALLGAGLDVRVLLPAYPQVLESATPRQPLADIAAERFPAVRLWEAVLPSGVTALLLDCAQMFDRPGGPYTDAHGNAWDDNALRFGLLSRAAALLAGAHTPLSWRPQVLHCNDWQTGLAPAYVRYGPRPAAATLMAVHNLAFQGIFPAELLGALGLPPQSYAVEGLEFWGKLSFLKAGLYYADALATVSPTYAQEIQHEELGSGLHGLLAARRDVLHGILNGIDTKLWDPASDPLLRRRYTAQTLDAKSDNKSALQARLGLAAVSREPLFGVIARLTEQKGCDLVLEAAKAIVTLPAQLAVLGVGEPAYERALIALAASRPDRIAVVIGFDEALAHLIEGGADALLMPSRFEPCGLNQMYSQRYGTPPIAHATGGLADSVVDATPQMLTDGTATGFMFRTPTAAALLEAIERAAQAYRHPAIWRAIQRNGMAREFSWRASANAYAALYKKLAQARRD